MQYVTYSLSKKALYETLKPHLQVLQFEIAFPLLCFNDQDALLWADNPLEYVRKGYDIIEDMYSARTAAINFLAELVTKRSKDTLDPFIAALVLILNRYNEAPVEQRAAQARQKDGALLAIGALHEKLQGTARYKAQLEHMLVTHVFPEFSSPCGFLRAKAAWVAGQYADIPFSNPAHFGGALQAVVSLLRDPELPVRVDAVVALRSFVDACEDLDQLRPIIPHLLDDFFKLMHEVENEDLVFTLEVIVDKFGEEMSPFAVGLIHNLAAAFWKCVRSSEAAEGEEESEAVDDMSALAAAGCLRAIGTVLESISSLPHLFPQLEPTLLPILQKMLSSDGQDLYEEVLEIATYMTYYSPTISPAMWSIWPLILSSLDEFAIDFFEYALDPLDNLISRGTEHFLGCQDPNYPDSLWKLLSKLMSDGDIKDRDLVPAPKLMEVVLLNCRGRVDHWLPLYLQLALARMQKASLRHMKDLLMQVVANGLYYNPQLTLQALEGMGATAGVFQTWLTMLHAKSQTTSKPLHFKRQHDKKVCVLGLVSLLSLPSAALPASVAPLQGELAKAVLQLLVAYKEQQDAAELESEDEDEDDEEGEDGMGEGGEDEDEEEDEEEEGDESSSDLKKAIKRAHKMLDGDDEEDEDDEGFWSDEDEMLTPIDAVDPFILFSDTMAGVQASDPARFSSLMESLDFSHQAMAHKVSEVAQQQRDAKAKEAAEKAAGGAAAS
ncbi:hypothetical protein CLOM_g11308 [Closterium sp. NIES-68]|nr:hypothetical protein CLOM_g11308 [Closterium sp. NIES-68]